VEVCGGIVAEEGTALIEDTEREEGLMRMEDWSDSGAWRWKTWIVLVIELGTVEVRVRMV